MWMAVEEATREVTRLFGYQRIDVPTFEAASLFEKSTGDTTDIVEKEMYVFTDRGGEKVALTPEATPSIARAYLEHGMASSPQPVRLYTNGRMFRYDRPQKGRTRQFTQFDCEVIGSSDPLVDAELIQLLWDFYRRLGIVGLEVRLSSIDDFAPRRLHIERLQDFYRPHLGDLSEDSQRRFDRNPLRLLDSKDARDEPYKADAPKLIDHLSDEAATHFEQVRTAVSWAGIPFTIDPLMVRGLDYYNRTVFEFVPKGDDRAQGTVGGGGRYDGLIEIMGGPPTPGIGFATSFERIIIEMERSEVSFDAPPETAVFIVHRGEGTDEAAFRVATQLRDAGIATIAGESGRSFKSQMRRANHSSARAAVILGEDEVERSIAIVKDLRDGGDQREVPIDKVADALRTHADS
jgi:histidyl-tRNA synthetase